MKQGVDITIRVTKNGYIVYPVGSDVETVVSEACVFVDLGDRYRLDTLVGFLLKHFTPPTPPKNQEEEA